MSGLRRTGRLPSALRLDDRFRWALYAAVAVLFVTGAVWLVTNPLKDSANGELWQGVSADLLMIHGGATMVTLLLLGALVPVHIQRAWRIRRNRSTGTMMVTANILLIATAFGLYYAGLDALRDWISDVHIAVGVILPVLLVCHIVVGRRRLELSESVPRTVAE